jgi:hypothetical protein
MEQLVGGAIADGTTVAKNASVDGPLKLLKSGNLGFCLQKRGIIRKEKAKKN